MPRQFDYTTRARKMAFKFPVFTFISIQVNYWIVAFLLFSVIMHFTTLLIDQINPLSFAISFKPALLVSIILGLLFGVILGFLDILVEKSGMKRWSLGLIILLRIITYPILLFSIVHFMRFVILDWLIAPFFPEASIMIENQGNWRYFAQMLLIYTAVMAGGISFINQMNKKFGPGVLLPLLLGKYRKPKEQERFFMFLDLKSSTKHAEELGHLRYSEMIRDSFLDINHVLSKNNAEIYQYVGDEVVITWPVYEGVRRMSCLSFFFDVQDEFARKQDHYIKQYGFVPEFKAGLHLGIVTAVEVGEIKRDIAYHGDTINTAARIQGLCNQFNKSLLISGIVHSIFRNIEEEYKVESFGNTTLKGKGIPVELFSLERK